MARNEKPKCIIDLCQGVIVYENKKIEIKGQKRRLLEYFISKQNMALLDDDIIRNVWDNEKSVQEARLRSLISKLTATAPPLKQCFPRKRAGRYTFVLPDGYTVIKPRSALKLPPLPKLFTQGTVYAESEADVIHREKDFRDIEDRLLTGENILLSGFGGYGKTSVARVLFRKLQNQKRYDHYGWIHYTGDLRENILTQFVDLKIPTEDSDERWDLICQIMENNDDRIFMVIDNVDRNATQDPLREPLFQEISCWPNVTLLLTSRLPELAGYSTYPLKPLGSEKDPIPAVDLFYFYYDKITYLQRQNYSSAAYALVNLADYHTYLIELMAKTAKKETSLSDYLQKLKDKDGQYQSSVILTKHSPGLAPAAQKLRILLDVGSRSQIERKILWDFAVLPDNTSLTREEVRFLLGYSENDLWKLDDEGWLKFSNGGYQIHPLVKEVVHFDLKGGKAPLGTAKRLVELVISEKLIADDDTQYDVLHKLSCAEGVVQFIRFTTKQEEVCFLFHLGMAFYKHARRRLSAIRFIEKALISYEKMDTPNSDTKALILYQLGYIKSTTHQYRKDSEDNLREALKLWEAEGGNDSKIAMAKDHLGYVLTDHSACYEEAKQLLQEALDTRKGLLDVDTTSQNTYNYSTTCDNLGVLLMRMGEQDKEAEELLREALSKREMLYSASEGQIYGTDVAWSAYNLAKLLSTREDCRTETEAYFNRALSIRREMDAQNPGKYKTNIVFTLVGLSMFLSEDANRYNEVVDLVEEAIALKETIDSEHSGFFSEEIDKDLVFLTEYISKNTKIN